MKRRVPLVLATLAVVASFFVACGDDEGPGVPRGPGSRVSDAGSGTGADGSGASVSGADGGSGGEGNGASGGSGSGADGSGGGGGVRIDLPDDVPESGDGPVANEIADGLDNDGDGRVDEGIPCTSEAQTQDCYLGPVEVAGKGRCALGTQACEIDIRGEFTFFRWGACEGSVAPGTEVCNGEDDDCDGAVDEGCECTGARACGTSCGAGEQACENGLLGECSAPGVRAEICNGADDDCDGETDENLRRACRSACGPGVETCTAGAWGGCSAPLPVEETCNGKDDDCDGSVDEGCECVTDEACSSACGPGTRRCLEGAIGPCSAPQPEEEICNGEDDDCDGAVDEDLTRACRTECGGGFERCEDGKWTGCNAPEPGEETCNRQDDDCDGVVDEGCECVEDIKCFTSCGSGVQPCEGGKIGECTAPKADPEICNGMDDDCDGQVDEFLLRVCGTDCGFGLEICSDGAWSGCTAREPEEEVCNDRDDDCDGVRDEDLTRSCSTKCGDGDQLCTAGVWSPCDAQLPRGEQCNGQDDDCDGQTDENLTQVCFGQCGLGEQACQGGGTWTTCDVREPDAEEICDDQIDNDCDGSTDCNDSGCTGDPACETACTPFSEEFEASTEPLDVYVALDRSGSMNGLNKWGKAVQALKEFIADGTSQGVKMALEYFPKDTNTCDADVFSSADVSLSTLPESGSGPLTSSLDGTDPRPAGTGTTPTVPALQGLYAMNQSGGTQAVNVLMTDGVANYCDASNQVILTYSAYWGQDVPAETTDDDLAEVAQGLYQSTDVPTYVIGMTGASFRQLEAMGSVSGAPEHTNFCQGGDATCHYYDVGDGSGDAIVNALKAIRRSAVTCEYDVAKVKTATDVSVTYFQGGTGSGEALAKWDDVGGCSSDGFYVDKTAGKVVLCPLTCGRVQGDDAARIVVDGC